MAFIRERAKNYSEAIRLCNEAIVPGWRGDWETRIARCVSNNLLDVDSFCLIRLHQGIYGNIGKLISVGSIIESLT